MEVIKESSKRDESEELRCCPKCGGNLEYIQSFNMIVCDTCDYELKEVM